MRKTLKSSAGIIIGQCLNCQRAFFETSVEGLKTEYLAHHRQSTDEDAKHLCKQLNILNHEGVVTDYFQYAGGKEIGSYHEGINAYHKGREGE